jgi:MoaA/NifB/PqqE/SkfB family radical SAM enzyme
MGNGEIDKMQAEVGKRFNRADRTDLTKVIPLETPLVLFIDPASACNFKCNFCPCCISNKANWSEHKKVGMMSYELFRKIIDDATKFPQKIKTLRLYKEGEPLLNKRLPDMIRYAKQKDVADKIDFTTNGSLLTRDLSLALIDAGLDKINISVESLTEEGYKNTSGVDLDMAKFKENLKFLYANKKQCRILIKISDYGLEEHSEQEFYEMFGDMCDEIAVEHVAPVWPEFDLSDVQTEFKEGLHGNEIRECQVCPYIFYSICINSSGTVSSCLMDWNHLSLVGDVNESSIVDVWNNQHIQNMRIKNLEGKRNELGICKDCGQMKFATIDNIDHAKDELLKKVLKEAR